MMKNLILILAIVLSVASCKKSQSPVEYNNKMAVTINNIQGDMNNLNTATRQLNYAKAEEYRLVLEKKLGKAITDINAIGDFNGDATYKDQMIKTFNKMQNVIKNEFKTALEKRKNFKNGTEEEAEEIEDLITKLDETLSQSAAETLKAGNDFKAKYKK